MKEFDCLEFKDKVQEQIYNNIRNLTIEQEKDYFNSKAKQGSFKDFVISLNYTHQIA
jgi:hypothetical protein